MIKQGERARKFRYWFGHRQGHCDSVMPGVGGVILTCDRPRVHDGPHKDAGTGATWMPLLADERSTP